MKAVKLVKNLDIIAAGHRPKVKKITPSQDRSWRLGANREVYFKPVAKCIWCQASIKLQTIWFVDTRTWTVDKVIDTQGRRWKDGNGNVHPHVSGGRICRGNATTLSQALWFSFNPESSYSCVAKWFQELGHECEGVMNIINGTDYEDDEEEEDCYCVGCDNYFLREDVNVIHDNYYCQGCQNSLFKSCDECDDNIDIKRETYFEYQGNVYCEDCGEGKHLTFCDECDAMGKLGEDIIETTSSEHNNTLDLCKECREK